MVNAPVRLFVSLKKTHLSPVGLTDYVVGNPKWVLVSLVAFVALVVLVAVGNRSLLHNAVPENCLPGITVSVIPRPFNRV